MKDLTKLLITIITTLALVVGVMIPITSGLEDNIKTTHLNSSERFVVMDDNLDLYVEMEEIGVFKLNGREVIGESTKLIIADGLQITLNANNFVMVDQNNNITITSTNTGKIVEFVDGTYTYTYNNNEYTGTTEKLLYPDDRGSYGAFISADLTVDVDEEMYLISIHGNGAPRFVLESLNGVFNWDNALLSPYTISSNTITEYSETITINTTYTESEDGLTKSYTALNFTAGGVTNNFIVYAPLKYHEWDTNAEAIKSIVNVLPLVILIGLIVVAGYYLINKTRSRSEL